MGATPAAPLAERVAHIDHRHPGGLQRGRGVAGVAPARREAGGPRGRSAPWRRPVRVGGVTHTDASLFTSPTLTARRFLLTPDHPEVGARAMAGVAWMAARAPMRVTVPAPCLGADTRSVLCEVLGFSDDAIDALAADDLLADGPA